MRTYADLPNRVAVAADDRHYAYRDTGSHASGVPLVLLQHFRGNLDNWDPALIDQLGVSRRVITLDYAGVGASTGVNAQSVEDMARDTLFFITALELRRVDLLGFSIGSFVAQEIALRRPALVRRLVLASSAPKGAAGMHGWAPAVIDSVGTPHTTPEGYLGVFFAPSEASQRAGKEALGRMYARKKDRDEMTDWTTREAQYDAVCAWGIPNHSTLERLGAIEIPVFIANGESDPMILPRYSYLLAGLIPQARVRLAAVTTRLGSMSGAARRRRRCFEPANCLRSAGSHRGCAASQQPARLLRRAHEVGLINA